jgi:hypothetical protein
MNVFIGKMNSHSIMVIFRLRVSIKLIRVLNILAGSINASSNAYAVCTNDSNGTCQYSEQAFFRAPEAIVHGRHIINML